MRVKRITKFATIRCLNALCAAVDEIAYRPVFLKLTSRLGWNWNCRLARISIILDERWKTGYWGGESAPIEPGPPCEACKRRPSMFVTGGWLFDDETDGGGPDPNDSPEEIGSYLASNEVSLCGWCRPVWPMPPHDQQDVAQSLRDAAARSIAWRWRRE